MTQLPSADEFAAIRQGYNENASKSLSGDIRTSQKSLRERGYFGR